MKKHLIWLWTLLPVGFLWLATYVGHLLQLTDKWFEGPFVLTSIIIGIGSIICVAFRIDDFMRKSNG